MLYQNLAFAVDHSLTHFDPIGLDALNDRVQLMKRVDTKFTLHIDLLLPLLDELRHDYFVLFVDETRLAPYETLYFDTEEFDFYNRHHNQCGTRHKIRYRRYVNSNINFFELKQKHNTGLTIKKRIPSGKFEPETYRSSLDLFTRFYLKNETATLMPKLWVYFSRITLARKDFSERATLDLGLTYRAIGGRYPISDWQQIVIAELKQPKLDRSSPLLRALKRHGVNPMRISKYCMGMLKCYDHLRYNRFKPKLRILDALGSQSSATLHAPSALTI